MSELLLYCLSVSCASIAVSKGATITQSKVLIPDGLPDVGTGCGWSVCELYMS